MQVIGRYVSSDIQENTLVPYDVQIGLQIGHYSIINPFI